MFEIIHELPFPLPRCYKENKEEDKSCFIDKNRESKISINLGELSFEDKAEEYE